MALISQQNDVERLFFWDYLRTFVVVIVVLHHSALAYLAFVPYKWIVMDESKNIIFDFFALINDPFLMPSLFFVSGYFSLYSLFKRGSSNFIKTRFDRLMIPFILGLLTLCPIIFYVKHLARGENVGNYLNYWLFVYYQSEMHASHLWFLPILMAISLCFALGYALNPRLRKYLNTTEKYKYNLDKFNFKTLLLFGILTSLLFLSINLFIPDAKWIEFGQKAIVRFQPTRISLYFCYFAIGVIAYKKQWKFVEVKYALKTVLIWSIAALLLATTRLIFIYNFAPLLETSIFIKFINALTLGQP